MSAIASILGTGHYVPSRVLTNFDLEKIVETSDEWIRTRTGIRERHLAAEGEWTSDMATQAARKALESSGTLAEELDAIIMATITPDLPWPASACLVQEKLGARKAFCFDLSAACSGFVYGLSVASGLVVAGGAKRVLVLGAERLSSIVDWKDRNTCVLFGDGAGAAVVGPDSGRGRLLSFHLGSDGSAANLLYMPAGGSRQPASSDTLAQGLHFLRMDGKEVFKFAVKVMGEGALQAVEKAGLKPADIDLLIPHQANIRIIESAAKRMDLSMERVFVNVDRYGNTSAATVPIALDEAQAQGRLQRGQKAVLVAFGGGLTWGATVVEW
jgi:3-oxoacyl-[acyl-carrier-protein] synthase-3